MHLNIQLLALKDKLTRTGLVSSLLVYPLVSQASIFFIFLVIFGSQALGQRSLGDYGPFFISDDPNLERQFCRRVMGPLATKPSSVRIFEGYEYSRESGLVVDESGFVPSITEAPKTPRRLTYDGKEVTVDRYIDIQEIKKIHQLAKKAVAKAYKKSIQGVVRQLVDEVENTLRPEQSGFGVVRDKKTGKVLGVLRAFEGYIENGKIILPSLEVMRKRGLLTISDEEHIRKKLRVSGSGPRSDYLNVKVYEIGQFYIDPTLTETERIEIRVQLTSWFMATYVNPLQPEAIMLAHVSRPALERHYNKLYGFKDEVIQKSFEDKKKKGAPEIITEKIFAITSGELDTHMASQGP